MGYYDFDEHFWAVHEVCGQQPKIVARKIRFFSLRKLFSLVFKKHIYQDELKPDEALNSENKSNTLKKGELQSERPENF